MFGVREPSTSRETSMFRRTAVPTLVAALVASLSLLAPAHAAPPSDEGAAASTTASTTASTAKAPVVGKRCRDAGKFVYEVRDVRRALKVAYARSFVLSPSETLRRVRHVSKDETVSSSY